MIHKDINRVLLPFGESISTDSVGKGLSNAVRNWPGVHIMSDDKPALYSYQAPDWTEVLDSERMTMLRLPSRTEQAIGHGNPFTYCAYRYYEEHHREKRPWQWFACQLVMGLSKIRDEIGGGWL